MTKRDTQQIEILGRAALAAELLGDGLEVASPDRDAGIDLLAFSAKPWRVMPIQMKAAPGAAFCVDRKYECIDRLVMVYVWNIRSGAEFYAMSWKDAVEIAASLGWTSTDSWTRDEQKGRYATSRPPDRVRNAVESYRMTPGKWGDLLDSMVVRAGG
jgi:hypothetical protein